MQVYFSSLDALQRFTHSLQMISHDNACLHCKQNDQWVSHGCIYNRHNDVTGKRIMCSARYGKKGCGLTRQLYLKRYIPRRWYDLETVVVFIGALLRGTPAPNAYRHAINNQNNDARQAWRWLDALYARLGCFRSRLAGVSKETAQAPPGRSARMKVLLPTLEAMVCILDGLTFPHPVLHPRFF